MFFIYKWHTTWLFLISSFGRGMAWNLVPWGVGWLQLQFCSSLRSFRRIKMSIWNDVAPDCPKQHFSCPMSFLYNDFTIIPQTSICSLTRFHQWAVAGHRSADSRKHHGKGTGGAYGGSLEAAWRCVKQEICKFVEGKLRNLWETQGF